MGVFRVWCVFCFSCGDGSYVALVGKPLYLNGLEKATFGVGFNP